MAVYRVQVAQKRPTITVDSRGVRLATFRTQPATATRSGLVRLAGDLGGSAESPQVVDTHLATPLPPDQGGTGKDNGANTLIIPAAGTAALRSGSPVADRLASWADGNQVEDSGIDVDDVARTDQPETFTDDVTVQGDLDVDGVIRGAVVGVPVFLNARLYCGFDGDEPFETDFTGDPTGHRGQSATVSGGVIYRPGRFGKSIQVAKGTTNLVTNPSFEVDLSGWSTVNGGTWTRETGGYYGSYCLKGATTSSAQSKVFTITGATPGATITVSAWAKADVGSARFYIADSGYVNTVYSASVSSSEWTRITASKTVAADGVVKIVLHSLPSGGTAEVYFDAVQAEENGYVTPYCDGSLGAGHSWSGTAHASTSSRTVAAVFYSVTSNVQDAGTVLAWVRFPMRLDGSLTGFGWNDFIELVGSSGENTDAIWLRWADNTGALDVRIVSNGATVAAGYPGSVGADEWHHVAWSWNSNSNVSAVYWDGVSIATGGFGGFSVPMTTLHLNQNGKGGIDVDELALTDYALSAQEIAAIYNSQAALYCV